MSWARSFAPLSDRIAPSPLRSPPSEREGRAPLEPLSWLAAVPPCAQGSARRVHVQLLRGAPGRGGERRGRRGCGSPCARRRRDARLRKRGRDASASSRVGADDGDASATAAATPAAMSATRVAAPAARASSAASPKLKVCGPITTGQPHAAASIRFWPPSGAKLPPSRATSASAYQAASRASSRRATRRHRRHRRDARRRARRCAATA